MTKQEKKLKELGYIQDPHHRFIYIKQLNMSNIYAYLNNSKTYCDLELNDIPPLTNQTDLEQLAEELNIMQKDLEELRLCHY